MDELEPYWEEVDGLVQEKIRFVVAPAHFKHFDACRFKLKALWYINSRVEDLDLRYGQLVDSFLNQETYDRFVKGDDGSWSYFPFFEAVEFENLLTQSKACLDCFSKAVGSTFGELPNNVSALERVLRSKQSENNRRTAQAEKLLQKIDEAKDRLTGIVLDPGNDGKKSIRDLVSHREHASIHFRITRAQQRSSNALINGAHPEIVRLPNYRVTEISETVWYHTKKLVEESLPLLL